MKVAVCIDNREPCEKVLDRAVEFADKTNSSLTLIHSVKENVNNHEQVVKESSDKAIDRGKEILNRHQNRVEESEYNIDVDKELLHTDSSTVDTIIEYINRNNFDYVYIGHRALETEKEKMFGSFAKTVISHSKSPITVVPNN